MLIRAGPVSIIQSVPVMHFALPTVHHNGHELFGVRRQVLNEQRAVHKDCGGVGERLAGFAAVLAGSAERDSGGNNM